ncbi:MAG TPA: carboxypeptidase regulatory-like domain-containing protein, partial [Blastocatellia bacterium]|nr:carboxypeptidase regulatory-like domain-containing protein [Blastocatellia bacterium]
MTKGIIRGRVMDSNGAAIASAKVTITGQAGDRTGAANAEGEFEMQNLIPGVYKVKVEQTGFKTLNVPGVEVYVGKTSALKLTLEAGNISEVVEVTAGAAAVDTTSTAIGSNLNDQLYKNLPLERSVQSLFYLAPGAADGLGGGQANPSISGGSALDNLYIADGVNITDSAFGGLGVFNRMYGSLGTAINTTFIKEVQVKTGGFEPQFGQSQGGIVNIITKSGTNQYHGEVFGFFQPKAFEMERLFVDDLVTNKSGKLLHPENYDTGFEFGGPAPGLKDRVLFFGSFNPTVRRDIVRGAEGSGLFTILGNETHRRTYTKSYAAKVDANLGSKHQVNFSIFGDPSTTNVAPFRTLNIDNTTANSRLEY